MHTQPSFRIRASITTGWNLFTKHLEILIELYLLYFLIAVAGGLVTAAVQDNVLAYVLISMLRIVFTWFLMIGIMKAGLKIRAGERATIRDLFSGKDKLLNVILVYILLGLILTAVVVVPVILAVIAGVALHLTAVVVILATLALCALVYVSARLTQSVFIIIDTSLSPVAALKRSWKITKGSFWRLLGFLLLLCVINFGGLIALIIGLLVTIPFTMMCQIVVYKKLAENA